MELAITIVVTILAAILSAVFWPMWKRYSGNKTKSYLLTPNNPSKVQEAIDFYLERIHYDERIPPSFIKYFLESKEHSVKSIDELEIVCNTTKAPSHIFLVCECEGVIVGIMKLIYMCEINSFFIAYYAAKPSSDGASAAILNSILSFILGKLEECDCIYYEICENREDKDKAVAKSRLFKHYAMARGFKVKCIVGNYLQPEIAAFDEGFTDPVNGRLYGIAKCESTLESRKPEEVFSAIFSQVYADSFFHLEKNYYAKYVQYLSKIRTDMGLLLCEE